VEQAIRLAARFALIAANNTENRWNQRLVRTEREVVRGQTEHAVKNGLTKQQVLDVIEEILC
jgi:hypothetical protein